MIMIVMIIAGVLSAPGSRLSASAAERPLRRHRAEARCASEGRPAPDALQELLDRTLALVGGQPITLSDARAAIALGLIDNPKDSLTDMTTRLVDRALVLREVQRYAPPAPEESRVESRLAAIRQRLGGSFNPTMEAHGFTETRLRGWIGDDLRTQAYLAQRFASASLPSDSEVAAVYNRQRAEFDKSGLTFEQAAPIVRERLIEERRRELVVDWVADLRRRTDVVILTQ